MINAKNWTDNAILIAEDKIDEFKSKYGNRYVGVTEEDMKLIKQGAILCVNDGEYCTFIKLA